MAKSSHFSPSWVALAAALAASPGPGASAAEQAPPPFAGVATWRGTVVDGSQTYSVVIAFSSLNSAAVTYGKPRECRTVWVLYAQDGDRYTYHETVWKQPGAGCANANVTLVAHPAERVLHYERDDGAAGDLKPEEA